MKKVVLLAMFMTAGLCYGQDQQRDSVIYKRVSKINIKLEKTRPAFVVAGASAVLGSIVSIMANSNEAMATSFTRSDNGIP